MDDLKWAIAREVPHLRRFAIALSGDESHADDLVQDTVERAITKRHLWTRRGSLRSWLFRILYRQHVDGKRSVWTRIANRSVAESDVTLSQSADQEQRMACRDIGEALDRLPADQRAAVLLVALEGLSYDEAANALGVPIGTLRSRLSRARHRLGAVRDGADERPALMRVK